MSRARRPRRDRLRVPTPVLGLVGTLLIVAVVVGAIRFDSLPLADRGREVRVELAEAGGLQPGDDVVVSGAKVGTVRALDLRGTTVEATLRIAQDDLRLGAQTRAKIVTITLLGQAALQLVPAGEGELRGPIPRERTTSPYDVTAALSQLTTETAQIDVDQLASSLQQVSSAFADTPAEVRPALEGVARLSQVISRNDATLRRLLARAGRVTAVLADRDAQVTSLLRSGQDLLGQLTARREVVDALLVDATRVSRSVRALSEENTDAIGPALDQLDAVVDVLRRNRAQLDAALDGVRDYATAFGEAVSTGPFFDAYIQNLTSPATLAPILSAMLEGGAS
ncbi:MCE family protein [Nocardioides sp. TRM66260-LWL]|uniref:MCE family protein n=1 Tax=Nocardioides sp. TRM66260-LWL TaxID=2874478 RepID=UPI001CC5F728|nr:MCE family protein [Nocardioides sp. TRM66260-LWL]MBZ5732992.1 MCE family protein [Nocardioides sp. TRM66260-LWL]